MCREAHMSDAQHSQLVRHTASHHVSSSGIISSRSLRVVRDLPYCTRGPRSTGPCRNGKGKHPVQESTAVSTP
jgi:hypothetical protein